MLLSAHEKYHSMAPKDVKLQGTMPVQLSRTVSETGEQFTMEVPIYPDDSREEINDRIGFALSIMQDRLEDVNKAMLEAKAKAMKAQHVIMKTRKIRALKKRLDKGKITQDQFDQELSDLDAALGEEIENVSDEARTDDEIIAADAHEGED